MAYSVTPFIAINNKLKAIEQMKLNSTSFDTVALLVRIRLSEEYRVELEDAISAAIAPGISAQELSRNVRKYLNEPDLKFRRFRYKNENGEWKRKWKKRYTDDEGNVRFIDCDRDSYRNQWNGPGYYKSAAKNAMRLARTEINMSYRTAEQERWRQFDFVVGYEVKTTQNGRHRHVEDICDRLAGKYPKDFKFVGWHPQCMCYTIPILKTEDEFWAYDPENPQRSTNEITDVPQNFKDWIKDNRERIESAEKRGKLPYFIRDNRKYVENILNPKSTEIRDQQDHLPMEFVTVPGGSYLKPLTRDEKLDTIIELTYASKEDADRYLDAVESFSHGWDYEIREYQRTGSVQSLKPGHTIEEVSAKSRTLEEFLLKSPQWVAPTYRGMGLTEEEYANMLTKLKEGTFDMRGSASWSSNIKDAEQYAKDARWEKPRLVVFECEKNGRATSIRHLSLHPDENEVLVSNGVKYRIIGEPVEDKINGRISIVRIKLEAIGTDEINSNSHYGSAMKLGREATKEAMKLVDNIGAPELSEIQKKNIRELADALGIPRKEIKPMSFLDADQGASNPTGNDCNCQSCVVAFSARRRGLDCYAKASDSRNPSKEAFQLGERFQDGWLNPKTGKPLQPTMLRGRNDGEIIAKLKRTLSQPGEYVLGTNDKKGKGHVVNIINSNGKIIIHDEQAKRGNDRYWDIDSIKDIDYLEVIKIDKAIFNIELIKHLLFR